MPYIPQKDRDEFNSIVQEADRLFKLRGVSKGELNYLITMLGILYLNRHTYTYSTISDAIAGMRDAADELRERVMKPYEKSKIRINGDVYPIG